MFNIEVRAAYVYIAYNFLLLEVYFISFFFKRYNARLIVYLSLRLGFACLFIYLFIYLFVYIFICLGFACSLFALRCIFSFDVYRQLSGV